MSSLIPQSVQDNFEPNGTSQSTPLGGVPLEAKTQNKAFVFFARERKKRRSHTGFPWIPVVILSLVLIIPGLFADWIAPYGAEEVNLRARLRPPLVFWW